MQQALLHGMKKYIHSNKENIKSTLEILPSSKKSETNAVKYLCMINYLPGNSCWLTILYQLSYIQICLFFIAHRTCKCISPMPQSHNMMQTPVQRNKCIFIRSENSYALFEVAKGKTDQFFFHNSNRLWRTIIPITHCSRKLMVC